jgi:hypothetical protein
VVHILGKDQPGDIFMKQLLIDQFIKYCVTNRASYGGFLPAIGFPSVYRPNGTYKAFGNSFIITYLGSR